MPLIVYADILVIVNLYIDFFLLWCVKKFLHLRAGNLRLVLGGLAGGFCSLVSLIPGAPRWALLLLGLLLAFLTAAAAFAPLPPAAFFQASLAFWMFSFLLAGIFLFLLQFLPSGNVAVLGTSLYFNISLKVLFFGTCGAFFLFWLFGRLFPQDTAQLRFRMLLVEYRGKKAELFAKADTGCTLREPFSGLPVMVCQKESLKDIAPQAALCFGDPGAFADPSAAFGSGFSGEGIRLIPFTSVGGSGVLPAFRPDRVIDKKTGEEFPCCIALSSRKLSAGQFNALYNPDQFCTGPKSP